MKLSANIFLVMFLASGTDYTGKVSVINSTPQTIVAGTLQVYDKEIEVGRIEPGGRTQLNYELVSDGGYFLMVKLESGPLCQASCRVLI